MAVSPTPLNPDSRLTVVWGGDWSGVYLDDDLVCQGHSVSAQDLLRALGYEPESVEMNDSYEENGEPLPDALADLDRAERA